MNQKSKLRLTVLVTALATTAVFAGTYTALDETQAPPMAVSAAEGTTVVTQDETVVTPLKEPETTTAQPAPIAVPPPAPAPKEAAASQEPKVIVTEQRLTEDERIQREVMDVLANNERLSGKVGVETKDRVVTLSGYLMTSGQVWRAGRDAHVVGVRYVINEIRPRVGPVTGG
jgi:hypothetical protein